MCIDIRCNSCSMRIRHVCTNVDLKNSSKTNINLYSPVLIEVVIPNVFYFERESVLEFIEQDYWQTVISQCADHVNYESPTSDGMRSPAGTVVSVLPEHSGIFFVNAYSVIDHYGTSIVGGKTSRLSMLYHKLVVWSHECRLLAKYWIWPIQSHPKARLFAITPIPYSPLQTICWFVNTGRSRENLRVKGKLPGVRMFRCSVRNNHFRQA